MILTIFFLHLTCGSNWLIAYRSYYTFTSGIRGSGARLDNFPMNFNRLAASMPLLLEDLAINRRITFDPGFNPKKPERDPTITVIYDIATGKEIQLPDSSSLHSSIAIEASCSPPYRGLFPANGELLCGKTPAAANVSTKTIIYTDNRQRVTSTTSFPWSTICKLYITAADFTTWVGSGAIIDETHVLTCGHNVYLHDHGGWADSIEVVPGKGNGAEPYGSAWASNMRSYTGWTVSEDTKHDWAVLTLDSNIGASTGWMGLWTAAPSHPWYTGLLNTAGYPGDLDSGINMYWTSDYGLSADEYNHWYSLDVASGQSGSPVWHYYGSNRYICSIIAYGGSTSNWGTRLNQNKYDDILKWLDEDANRYPDMKDRGTAYANFSPAVVGPGVTNFSVACNIENLGAGSTRTFTVSYYASANENISSSDYLIGTDTLSSIGPGSVGASSWNGIFPSSVPNGTYYVGWIIDVNDTISESDENNNWAYLSSSRLSVDGIPPTIVTTSTPQKVRQGKTATFRIVGDPSASKGEISIGDLVTDDVMTSSGNGTFNYEWDTMAVPVGTYDVSITLFDSVGNAQTYTTTVELTSQFFIIILVIILIAAIALALAGAMIYYHQRRKTAKLPPETSMPPVIPASVISPHEIPPFTIYPPPSVSPPPLPPPPPPPLPPPQAPEAPPSWAALDQATKQTQLYAIHGLLEADTEGLLQIPDLVQFLTILTDIPETFPEKIDALNLTLSKLIAKGQAAIPHLLPLLEGGNVPRTKLVQLIIDAINSNHSM